MPPKQFVSGSSSTAGPALIEFNKQLWCVHNDGNNHKFLWSTVLKGTDWQGEYKIDKNFTNSRPALATLQNQNQNQLWCAYQGNNNGLYIISSDDGQIWSDPPTNIPNNLTSDGPALAVFGGPQLWYVYRGTVASGGPLWALSSANNWQTPPNRMGGNSTSMSPALAVFKGLLWCVYRGNADHGLYVATSKDGGTWTTPGGPIAGLGTDAAPALVYLPDQDALLCVYGDSSGGSELYYAYNTSGDPSAWTSAQIKGISRAAGTGVGLAVIDGIIYLAYCAPSS
ncbi:hypothetical protein GCM10011491_46830 [Brucella endophytica]|uniref:Exo-alpha-sialidase n=2 Tax=Brucella endophytica TaxID=1963359 RepID=A0A916WN97_9HYPH|nr:hypothetical protein GCM10011491_46830 [Brucella endophytica]